jgi:hypothetical protein
MRRNLLVAMLALGLLVVGARVVIAGTATGRTPVDCIDTVWRSSTVSTSSTTWEAVPGFEADPTAIFPITVDVSALVSGAPRGSESSARTWASRRSSATPARRASNRRDRTVLVLVPVGGARRRREPARQLHPSAMAEPVGGPGLDAPRRHGGAVPDGRVRRFVLGGERSRRRVRS